MAANFFPKGGGEVDELDHFLAGLSENLFKLLYREEIVITVSVCHCARAMRS